MIENSTEVCENKKPKNKKKKNKKNKDREITKFEEEIIMVRIKL
jgi:hypothetical protein